MSKLEKIKSVQEFIEKDPDQGIERKYIYYDKQSVEINTKKQEVLILETPKWGKMLFLDGHLQSTTIDEVIYHNALVHPLLHTLSRLNKILILGGGEGATAREVLRWPVNNLIMVDYDKELIEAMQLHGAQWAKGSWKDLGLKVFYDCAWTYMKKGYKYDGVIIDLMDPDSNIEYWTDLLKNVIESVKESKGGFVMNAGMYLPWNTSKLIMIVNIIRKLCVKHSEFKYYIYTSFIPSFSAEWTFIVVSHKQKFMIEPEYLDIIPGWIRRSIKTLPDSFLEDISTLPILTKIKEG
jgi:spermidine synthase